MVFGREKPKKKILVSFFVEEDTWLAVCKIAEDTAQYKSAVARTMLIRGLTL